MRLTLAPDQIAAVVEHRPSQCPSCTLPLDSTLPTEGEPVVHALRRVLATAHDSGEALRALAEHSAMVSHIVILNDANDFRENVASSYAAGG